MAAATAAASPGAEKARSPEPAPEIVTPHAPAAYPAATASSAPGISGRRNGTWSSSRTPMRTSSGSAVASPRRRAASRPSVRTAVPWVTLALGDYAVKLALALTMLIPFRALMGVTRPQRV